MVHRSEQLQTSNYGVDAGWAGHELLNRAALMSDLCVRLGGQRAGCARHAGFSGRYSES